MRKIAILTCLKSNRVCTGASCLRALSSRERSFAPYAGEEVTLGAFFHCNGCEQDPETDEGMLEKLDRLKSEGVETVHLGVCTVKSSGTLCPAIAKIRDMLQHRDIHTVLGTH